MGCFVSDESCLVFAFGIAITRHFSSTSLLLNSCSEVDATREWPALFSIHSRFFSLLQAQFGYTKAGDYEWIACRRHSVSAVASVSRARSLVVPVDTLTDTNAVSLVLGLRVSFAVQHAGQRVLHQLIVDAFVQRFDATAVAAAPLEP